MPGYRYGQGMKRSLALAAATLVLTTSFAACSNDQPAVCTSVDSLKSSVDDLKNVDVTSSGAVGDLQTALSSVESNLADVKSDAKSQFSTQIDAVDTAVASLKTSIDSETSDPSAANVAAVAAAAPPVTTALQTLISDVQSTC